MTPPAANEPPRPPKRKRGAQPGNLNAFQRGRLSRLVHSADPSSLAELGVLIDCEIAALRAFARRLMERSQAEAAGPDPLETLQGLGLAFARIATLMRVQAVLSNRLRTQKTHREEKIHRQDAKPPNTPREDSPPRREDAKE
jgi:hypothetical protein